MRGSLFLAAKAVLLSTTVLSPVFADEVTPSSVLDVTTVYATRSPQSTFDVPAMADTIDLDQPGNTTTGTLSDVLDFVPGVEVGGGPLSNGQTVSIRGYDDEAIITLMDGRRQNFETGHDGRMYIDTSLLKSVEVVRGSSSAIYGGGGIGGVIAFETKDAADLLEPGQKFGVSTSLLYRSANNTFAPAVSAYGRTGALDLVGAVTYKRADDIETGDGNELDAKDRILSGLVKAGYTFNDYHTASVQYQRFNNDGQEPNNPAGTVSSSNPVVEKEVTDNQFSLKYAYDNPDNEWLNPNFHVYLNNTEVEELDLTGSNAGRLRYREFTTIGVNADNQSKFSFSETNNHTLSYGVEYYHDEMDAESSAGVFGGVPDAAANNFGVYLQDEIALDTGVGKFLVIPAVRYDHYSSENDGGDSQSEGAVSPKFSVSYKPTRNLMFYSSVAQAFRAPNLTEIYATGQHFPGVAPFFPNNNFVPNPDLKPETVTTVEIGAGIKFDDVSGNSDALQIKGAAYQSWGRDFISQVVNTGAGTTTSTNIDEAKLFGWEIEGSYLVGPFKAKMGLSYVEAEDGNSGEYLSNSVPLTLVSDLSYKIAGIDGVIGWKGRFANQNDKVGSSDTKTDGYGVHDLYFRWAPEGENLKDLTLDLGIENLFDKDYNRRSAALTEEGRSYVAKVSYKW